MQKSLGLLAFAALFSGCTTAKPVYLPDGRQGFTIDCDDWNNCFSRAGKLCKSDGYDIFAQNSESGTFVSVTATSVLALPVTSRILLIGCKAPKAQ